MEHRTLINRPGERNILHYTTAGRKTHPTRDDSPGGWPADQEPTRASRPKARNVNLVQGLNLRTSTEIEWTEDKTH
jgi:hypothetical protein